jgi:hypothetical protein
VLSPARSFHWAPPGGSIRTTRITVVIVSFLSIRSITPIKHMKFTLDALTGRMFQYSQTFLTLSMIMREQRMG